MTDAFQAALASFQMKLSPTSKSQKRLPDAGNEGDSRDSISRTQGSAGGARGNSYSLMLANHQMDRLQAGATEIKKWRKQRFAITVRDLPHEDIWKAWIETGAEEGVKVHVFIHAKNPEQVSSEWVRTFLLPHSRRPHWGSIELTQAMMDLLNAALANTEVSRMVLLSESCIPIAPMKEVLFQLWKEEKSWVNFRTSPDNGYDRDQKWGRVSAAISLGDISGIDIWPLFKDTVASDELYVPTLLRILGEIPKEGESDAVSRRCVTWVDWTTSPKHPATFESLGACRGWPADAIEKGCLFARKFHFGSVSREAWDDLIEKRAVAFEKSLAGSIDGGNGSSRTHNMPEDTRKLAEEMIAGGSSTTENISTHPPLAPHEFGGGSPMGHFIYPPWMQFPSYLSLHTRGVTDEQMGRRKRSRDVDDDESDQRQRTTRNRRRSWHESSHRQGGWDERGRGGREWSGGGSLGNSFGGGGHDVVSGYNHVHNDSRHRRRSRISDRQGGPRENGRGVARGNGGGEFETWTKYHHRDGNGANDYRDGINEGGGRGSYNRREDDDVLNNDNQRKDGSHGGDGYYEGGTLNDEDYSRRKDGSGQHDLYTDEYNSRSLFDTKRRRRSEDSNGDRYNKNQPIKRWNCPPGAVAEWDGQPETTPMPKPLDEYHSSNSVSMPHKRKIEELNWPPRNDNSYIPGTTTTTTEKSRVFHGNRAAEEECSEELEVVRIEPHKANEKPFACDGW